MKAIIAFASDSRWLFGEYESIHQKWSIQKHPAAGVTNTTRKQPPGTTTAVLKADHSLFVYLSDSSTMRYRSLSGNAVWSHHLICYCIAGPSLQNPSSQYCWASLQDCKVCVLQILLRIHDRDSDANR